MPVCLQADASGEMLAAAVPEARRSSSLLTAIEEPVSEPVRANERPRFQLVSSDLELLQKLGVL